MATITFGPITGDGTGTLTEWTGGYAVIWIGAENVTDGYDFGGGTVTLQISDENNADGARTLKKGSNGLVKTAKYMTTMYIPPSWLRYVMADVDPPGSADLNIVIETLT